jgi:syntaxin 1B/2/3
MEFLTDSEELRRRLDNIDKLVDEMMDTVYKFQSVTTVPERKIAIASFEATVLDANTRLRDTKAALDGMQHSNNAFQEEYGESRASEWSFRVASVSGHTKRLRSLFTKIASAQTMFESEMNRRGVVHGALTPESTGEIPTTLIGALPLGNTGGKIFSMASQEEQRLKAEDMKRVERSLREIREAFLQIAALVDSQGEMLDCIEFSVVNAKNYSHQANIQLIKARRKQRQRSLLWCCCGITLTVVIIIGILAILQVTGAVDIFKK